MTDLPTLKSLPFPLPAYALNAKNFCRVPQHDADGEFWSFETWVCKAVSWIGGTNPLCVDAWGRRCRCGADFMRARDELSFPVRFWFGEGGQSAAELRQSKMLQPGTPFPGYAFRKHDRLRKEGAHAASKEARLGRKKSPMTSQRKGDHRGNTRLER